jgi:hypothetical protein
MTRPTDQAPRDTARDRAWIELRAKCPKRSNGKPVEDPAHLPLFVAADEPGLPL